MKFIITLAFLSFLISCNEKPATPFSKKDVIVLIPSTMDLGKIEEIKLKTLDFEIVNRSEKDVKIVAKAKSCGCTNFDLPSEIVKANSRMKVQVTFDPSKVAGDFEKSVFMRLENGKILLFKFLGTVMNKKA